MENNKVEVIIVGAGPAGLSCAFYLAIDGYKVTVFEKTDKLYGQINIASVPPRKDEMLRICDYYDEIIKHYNIDIKLIILNYFMLYFHRYVRVRVLLPRLFTGKGSFLGLLAKKYIVFCKIFS